MIYLVNNKAGAVAGIFQNEDLAAALSRITGVPYEGREYDDDAMRRFLEEHGNLRIQKRAWLAFVGHRNMAVEMNVPYHAPKNYRPVVNLQKQRIFSENNYEGKKRFAVHATFVTGVWADDEQDALLRAREIALSRDSDGIKYIKFWRENYR
ncbi:MAG TPA: hypothetical protein PLJ74_12625 [Myxococcota bacterium]|nr:hypothetical protein [Myxococcota bacterium]